MLLPGRSQCCSLLLILASVHTEHRNASSPAPAPDWATRLYSWVSLKPELHNKGALASFCFCLKWNGIWNDDVW